MALIETCRAPLRELPSYAAARAPLLRQARLCRESQALNHALRFGSARGPRRGVGRADRG